MTPSKTFLNLDPAKQQAIIETALAEFGEKGYQAASINTMVKRLGIAKGSVYQYFSDKESLFLYLFARSMDEVKHYLRTVRDRSTERPLADRLRMTLSEGVRFIESRPAIYTLYVTLYHDRTLPLRETLLKSIRANSLDFIGSLLEQAKDRGELRPGIDIPTAGFMIDAVMDRFLLSRSLAHMAEGTDIFTGNRDTVQDWIDRLVSLLCLGVIDEAGS
ncbi:TetR/AcrR family transcriptional regulator [Desulfatiferula olefinivorans]